MMSLFRWLSNAVSWCLIGCVRGYQKFLSPIFGQQCRFQPTCSEYYILAVKKYGPIRGSFKGAYRILRCNPYCKGGEDWP